MACLRFNKKITQKGISEKVITFNPSSSHIIISPAVCLLILRFFSFFHHKLYKFRIRAIPYYTLHTSEYARFIPILCSTKYADKEALSEHKLLFFFLLGSLPFHIENVTKVSKCFVKM